VALEALGTSAMHSTKAWGDVPRENVIRPALVVQWPFSERFGWG